VQDFLSKFQECQNGTVRALRRWYAAALDNQLPLGVLGCYAFPSFYDVVMELRIPRALPSKQWEAVSRTSLACFLRGCAEASRLVAEHGGFPLHTVPNLKDPNFGIRLALCAAAWSITFAASSSVL